MKNLVMIAPALALGACATEDLEAWANGLSLAAYELDAEMNPGCPAGMYRQHVADAYATSYAAAPWQVDYRLNPMGGGYSYCAMPVDPRHYRDRGDDYRDGYKDGYRDGERDDRRHGRD